MKHLYLFAAFAAFCMPATAQDTPTQTPPSEGMYVAHCYVRQYSDISAITFLNFQLHRDEAKGDYVVYGLVDELMAYGTISQYGTVEKTADIRAVFDSEKGVLTLNPWQKVMRQQDDAGEWHDVYFTGGYCNYDFMDEETLKQTDNRSNLAVKDLPVELTVSHGDGYTCLSGNSGFFFVWENPAEEEIRFRYCDYFCVSGMISQFNAVGNAEGMDDDEHLPLPPHKAIYDSNIKTPIPYHAYVTVDGDILSVSNWQYGTYNPGVTPAVTFRRGDDGVWRGESLMYAYFGNPLYCYLWQIDESGELIGDEMNYSVTMDEDEWGNPTVQLPPHRKMLYDKPGGNIDYRTSNVPYAQTLTVYRKLPEIKETDNGGDDAIEAARATYTGTAPEYFNLQGMPLAHPARGTVVIERRGTSSRKIVF